MFQFAIQYRRVRTYQAARHQIAEYAIYMRISVVTLSIQPVQLVRIEEALERSTALN